MGRIRFGYVIVLASCTLIAGCGDDSMSMPDGSVDGAMDTDSGMGMIDSGGDIDAGGDVDAGGDIDGGDDSCSNMVRDGMETGVDCGGGRCPGCADGAPCRTGIDCASTVCIPTTSTCAAAGCTDGVQNGDETAVDCGGSCPGCPDGGACTMGGDCASGVCDPGTSTCSVATCVDVVQNGDESDVDCGGTSCPACPNGSRCTDGTDCVSGACDPGTSTCVSPSCMDMRRNGTETDVDCGGGMCPGCADGGLCTAGTDCASGICDPSTSTCSVPTCTDGVQNGAESDVDCGGGTCPACADGGLCTAGTDCASGVCDPSTSTCSVPTCTDTVRNGTEIDVDCGGGACPACAEGGACGVASDCATGFCITSVCTSFPSCQAILAAGLSTGNGTYTIDPDGAGASYAPFTVTCDMTTGGGGWTCIDPLVANLNLGFTLTDLAATGLCGFSGNSPQGQGTTGVDCRFDADAGFDFNTLRTSAVEIEVITGGAGHTSDLTQSPAAWGSTLGCMSFVGDVRFGTSAAPGAAIGLGVFRGVAACVLGGSFTNGTILAWDGDEATTTRGTVLRLELGEEGGEDEGWRWRSGCVYVRDEVVITGTGVAGAPWSWEDGTFAASCDDYRNPTGAYAYFGSTGDGIYAIDPTGGSSPFEVFCDMTTAGGGWTQIAHVRRETGTPYPGRVSAGSDPASLGYSIDASGIVFSEIAMTHNGVPAADAFASFLLMGAPLTFDATQQVIRWQQTNGNWAILSLSAATSGGWGDIPVACVNSVTSDCLLLATRDVAHGAVATGGGNCQQIDVGSGATVGCGGWGTGASAGDTTWDGAGGRIFLR